MSGTIIECRKDAFWRQVDAELARAGEFGASSGEIDHPWRHCWSVDKTVQEIRNGRRTDAA